METVVSPRVGIHLFHPCLPQQPWTLGTKLCGGKAGFTMKRHCLHAQNRFQAILSGGNLSTAVAGSGFQHRQVYGWKACLRPWPIRPDPLWDIQCSRKWEGKFCFCRGVLNRGVTGVSPDPCDHHHVQPHSVW